MRTDYVISSLPLRYSRDAGDPSVAGPLARAVTAGGAKAPGPDDDRPTPSALSVAARKAARERVRAQFEEARLKFTARTQPRDYTGKFRKVLARLKTDLGDAASEQLARRMEEAEAAGAIGNYAKAKEAGAEVVKLLDDVKQGDLQKGTIDNVRKGSRDLGKLLAYLPLPQGDTAQKVRFSDLPGPTAKLMTSLIKRVDDKLSNEDAAKYTSVLKEFMSGVRMMSSDEMSAELAKILRVLA